MATGIPLLDIWTARRNAFAKEVVQDVEQFMDAQQ